MYLLCFACVCSCIPERSTKSLSLHTLKMTLHRTGEDFVNVGTSASVIHTSGEWSGYMVADKVEFRDTGMDESNFAFLNLHLYFAWAGILAHGFRSLANMYYTTCSQA